MFRLGLTMRVASIVAESLARSRLAAAVLGAMLLFVGPCAASLKVVATIKPIHSLAAAILEGAAEPVLLLDGGASPHTYALKPSDAAALSEADAVIRVSQNLEVFLNKALATLPEKARVISLDATPGIVLYPVRYSASVLTGEDAERRVDAIDPHFWLDPENAIAIADYLAKEFSEMDPKNAALYAANAAKLKVALAALDEELKRTFDGLSARPFIVFHDVTQYLEKRYGLHGLGAVTLSPERPPGAMRLAAIRQKIRDGNAVCVFSEPQFPPKLIEMLIEGAGAKRGVLDEIGMAIPAGPGQYLAFMRANAESLASCLK